jgi:hypothetical protein
MRRMSGYPRWFYVVLLITFVGIVLSGLFLLPTMLTMRLEWDMEWSLAHDWRTVSVILHSFFGWLITAHIGALASIHMRTGLRRRNNIVSGFGLLFLFVLMGLSAIGIYYLGDDVASRAASVIHVVAALAAIVLFVWHHIRGDRYRRAHERR